MFRSGVAVQELFDYIIHWRRPEDLFLTEDNEIKEIKVFNYNEPEPNDIQQVCLLSDNLTSLGIIN